MSSRYQCFWDSKGKTREYVNGELVWVRDDYCVSQGNASAAIIGDTADFVSPIDGSVVRGRAGMRDHCARHNVVPTADLAGLPNKPLYSDGQSAAHRAETREVIGQIMSERYRK